MIAKSARRALFRRALVATFPVALWLVATFFLLGNTGRWLDDWYYVQRVPETDEIRSLVLDRPIHFWRPAYRLVVPSLATLLFDFVRTHHFICAAVHGANGLLLWRLLRALGTRPFAAAFAASLFVVFPAAFEVPFWLCNLPTGLSTLLCLASFSAVAVLQDARHGMLLSAASLGLATFGAACLNEQPAAMLAMGPLFWSVCRQGPWRAREVLCAWPVLAAVLAGVAMYSVGHFTFASAKPAVDGGSFFVAAYRLPAITAQVIRWSIDWTFSLGSLRRMLWHGLESLSENPVRALLALAAMGGSGVFWVLHYSSREYSTNQNPPSPGIRQLASIVLGIGLSAAALAPIVVTNYWLNPRILYAPGIGAAVVLAGVMSFAGDRFARPSRGSRRFRTLWYATGAMALATLSLAMVGVQRSFQIRDRTDQKILAQLIRLFPSPTSEAVFVPVEIDTLSCPDWAARYEGHFWGAFRAWWSSSSFVQLGFRRSDIAAGHALRAPSWSAPNLSSVRVEGVGRVAWSRVIPFSVNEVGNVRIVKRVQWSTPSGAVRELTIDHLTVADEDTAETFAFPAGGTYPQAH